MSAWRNTVARFWPSAFAAANQAAAARAVDAPRKVARDRLNLLIAQQRGGLNGVNLYAMQADILNLVAVSYTARCNCGVIAVGDAAAAAARGGRWRPLRAAGHPR